MEGNGEGTGHESRVAKWRTRLILAVLAATTLIVSVRALMRTQGPEQEKPMRTQGPEQEKRAYPPRWIALVLLLVAAAALAGGGLAYFHAAPSGLHPVLLQWSASANQAVRNKIYDHSHLYRKLLEWDMLALIPGYLLGLLIICGLGRRVFWTPRSVTWAGWGMALVVVAVGSNYAQDGLLWAALARKSPAGALLYCAQALAFVKFTALIVALAVGVAAFLVTVKRLVTGGRTQKYWESTIEKFDTARPLVIPPPVIERSPSGAARPAALPLDQQDWWADHIPSGPQARWAEGSASPPDGTTGETIGICVSGGGIRAATVTLGALQALRDNGVLREADHVVSVSGGGYTVGGMQLAMQPPPAPAKNAGPARTTSRASTNAASIATAADAFAPGSPEEDHLRRYSSYIADGLSQWVVALGVLFRNVTGALVIIGLTITTAGLAIGELYTHVFLTAASTISARSGKVQLPLPKFASTAAQAPGFPPIPDGIWYAIGATAVLMVLTYLARQLVSGRNRLARGLAGSAVALVVFGLLLAVLGIGLPALLWASSWVTWKLKLSSGPASAVSSLSLLTTYLGAVAATAWKSRATVTKAAGTATGFFGKKVTNKILPNSMVQAILLWLCLAFGILVALLFGGWVATSPLVRSLWALVPVGALVVLTLSIDQTALSMHPYYRRQLARAFAVRRDRAGVAVPYGDEEMTWLSQYAQPVTGFPAVTFAATANITGQDRTPPGRPAVPFMLAHDYIGGPATGWVRTDFIEKLTKTPLRNDLTVEAAVAISGAAFASAMGSQSRFYEVFLALTNVRLGAWLPNPYFVALKKANLEDWTIPGLPRKRRLSYFAREIFGMHPSTSRLLLCTDGGHYDNLGLVELLRRRCKLIYCIDASGASQPLADALAGAITLSREELGTSVVLDQDAFDLVPADRGLLKPEKAFASLNPQLSKSQLVTGLISYPAIPPGDGQVKRTGFPAAPGRLVFAQAALTPDLPYQLLDFPQTDPGFPHDSTGDQFFDAGEFDAYQTLGYFIGTKAAQSPAANPPPAG